MTVQEKKQQNEKTGGFCLVTCAHAQTESLVKTDRFMPDAFAESMKYPEISNISVIYCRDNKQAMVVNINASTVASIITASTKAEN